MKNILVRILGFPATLIHGDTLVADRWQWLRGNLKADSNKGLPLLDVGCGSGGFTIGTAKMGYYSTGLSWDERNQNIAEERAKICNADSANFSICDVRQLDKRSDLYNKFDYIVCTENIEHIINDKKLIIDISNCMKSGAKLLLTTPNIDFNTMYGETKTVTTPPIEDGRHVKVGYSEKELRKLCENARLDVLEIGYCSGFFSQKLSSILKFFEINLHYSIGWVLILPFRFLPFLFDKYIKYTGYSITLIAKKH